MLHPSLDGARACVFDAGGTLVHPDWPRLAALAEEAAGRSFGADEMRRAFGEMLRGLGSPEAGRPAFRQSGRRGLLVAVISNTEDGRAREALEAAGLAEHFDVIVDSHLVGLSKPDPAIFR